MKNNKAIVRASLDPHWPKWAFIAPYRKTVWFDTKAQAEAALTEHDAQLARPVDKDRDGAMGMCSELGID